MPHIPGIWALADVHPLHVDCWAREEAWHHLGPLLGVALPKRPHMDPAVRGSRLEVTVDLPVVLITVVFPNTSRVKRVQCCHCVTPRGGDPARPTSFG